MDLESELRQAMAEHVASASAPSSLVTAVHRRHRRRSARIRASVAVAAVAAVAIAVVPVRHAVRATPAGEPDGPGGVGPATVSTTPMPPLATPYPRSAASDGAVATASGSAASPPARGLSRRDPLRALMTYLPPGLRPEGLCVAAQAAGRSTTTCRWAGDGGAALEVRLVRDPALAGPEDIASASAPVLVYDQVHDQPAIVTEQAGVGRQVTWIERPGLGVLVSVSTPLGDRLMRIADGVRP
jgi:hypothetical protein